MTSTRGKNRFPCASVRAFDSPIATVRTLRFRNRVALFRVPSCYLFQCIKHTRQHVGVFIKEGIRLCRHRRANNLIECPAAVAPKIKGARTL